MSTYRIHALAAIDGAWVTPIERYFSICSRSVPDPTTSRQFGDRGSCRTRCSASLKAATTSRANAKGEPLSSSANLGRLQRSRTSAVLRSCGSTITNCSCETTKRKPRNFGTWSRRSGANS
jgi:hypothetical protein